MQKQIMCQKIIMKKMKISRQAVDFIVSDELKRIGNDGDILDTSA